MNKLLFVLVLLILNFSVCFGGHWTQKADFPGGAYRDAAGFVVENKAYVLCGTNELWEYFPVSDTWVQKSNPPFSNVYWPVCFGIGSFGYVYIDTANEFWRYDPVADSWTRQPDLPGLGRIYPICFVIGNKAYLGGGLSYTTAVDSFDGGFYVFDPSTNAWDSLANMPFMFYAGNGFTANGRGYVTGILDTNTLISPISPKVYEYNPSSDLWVEKADFPGIPRTDATAFSIGNIGYFGVGDTGTGGIFKDIWQYNAYEFSLCENKPLKRVTHLDKKSALILWDAIF